MKSHQSLPFYSGEILAGRVNRLEDRFATLSVRGYSLPLETEFISWEALIKPAERLAIGDRLQVVIQTCADTTKWGRLTGCWPNYNYCGYWLNCLPLFNNPWDAVRKRYQPGSVVEVEMIDYVNWYIARVRMPENLLVEMRTNDIQPSAYGQSKFGRKLNRGERFRVVIHRIYDRGFWVERFEADSTAFYLAESGFDTSNTSSQKIDFQEKRFPSNKRSRAIQIRKSQANY
jgi:hypothetical protein